MIILIILAILLTFPAVDIIRLIKNKNKNKDKFSRK